MAEKEENRLIGYDPLAWMDDEADKVEKDLLQSKIEQVETIVAETRAETESIVIEDQTQNGVASGIVLEPVQNIQNVVELHSKMINSLYLADKIEIDASEVLSIDTATMQLLIALKQTAVKTQKEVVFEFPSERFNEAAELLGLSEILEVEKTEVVFFDPQMSKTDN